MKKIKFEDLILFENEDYIVVNKPPHFSTLDDRVAEGKQNIIGLARDYWEDAQVCHRLDKETSGILAIAKNPDAYRNLSIQFEKRQVTKVYHAFVKGVHSFERAVVEAPIYAIATGAVRIDNAKGKDAKTIFNTHQVFEGYSLVECQPVTGRMHQIRIHLALLKAPILTDKQYGGSLLYLSQLKKKNFNLKKDTEEQPLIQRVALHARALKFNLVDGKELTVEAPYPKDLRALLNQLEKYAS